MIRVPTQLVGAPLGTDVNLEYIVEAWPKSINYWEKDNGEIYVGHTASSLYALTRRHVRESRPPLSDFNAPDDAFPRESALHACSPI